MMNSNQEGMINLMMEQQNMMNQLMMNNPQNMMNQQNMMMNQLMMNNQNFMLNQNGMIHQKMMEEQLRNFKEQQNQMGEIIKNQNFIFGQNIEEDINKMTVIFKVPYFYGIQGRNISVICKSNDKVSYIIKKYRMKLGKDYEGEESFIFNAKKINENLTPLECGLNNNSVIFVLNRRGIEGGNNCLT